MEHGSPSAIFEFPPFRFDFQKGLLFKGRDVVPVGRRGAQLLATLLGRAGEVVTKAELTEAVWGNLAVEEGNLSAQIRLLRNAMAVPGPALITTVPRVGYRLAVASPPTAVVAPAGIRMPSLAVLPFENLGGDPRQEYFADGLVEDLITGLARFQSLSVIARNSSFVYKGRHVDVRQVAQELGVSYVLEGSVRQTNNRLRVTAQLIDGSSGAHLWGHAHDGDLPDIFDVQDRITESVVAVVEPKIQHAEIERSRRERPQSVAAYDLYLQGLFAMQTALQRDYASAFDLFSQALLLEPENIRFLSGASEAIQNRISMGFALGPADVEICLALARRGLRHVRDDANAMAIFGMSLINGKQQDLGYATVKRAADLNPNSLLVVLTAGIGSMHCGSLEEAEAHFRRALELSSTDPQQRFVLTGMARLRMILGNYEEAIAWAKRSLAVVETYSATYWVLIAASALLGRMGDATRYLTIFRELAPEVTVSSIEAGQPNRDPSRLAATLEGLRKAGLPEF